MHIYKKDMATVNIFEEFNGLKKKMIDIKDLLEEKMEAKMTSLEEKMEAKMTNLEDKMELILELL